MSSDREQQALQNQAAGPPPAEGERYGDYEVIKPLTSGGMADIFLARKLGAQGFNKLVVVKRIRRDLVKDDHLVDMFIDEAHVAARLDHPNVVVISDLGEVDDSYFMAMEYLRGQTLRALEKKLIERGKSVPPHFWARVMEYALDGLHYAHELRGDNGALMGLVHRDFTPSNIMITYTGTVKVIDFGVAHVEAPTRHETKIGTIKGKIAYMSPEQCRATAPVDRQTDVFAAGIVLWELLSHRQLFDGPTDTAIIVEILLGQIPPPGGPSEPIDLGLQDIVMKALQRDQAKRYMSAADMRDDLREYLRAKEQKVDATDIGKVMSQLFAEERAADDALTSGSGRVETGSRSNPGQRHSSSSRSGRGSQPSATPVTVQRPARRGLIIAGTAALVLLAGFGVWRFTRPVPVVVPPPVQVAVVVPPPVAPVEVKPAVVEKPPVTPEVAVKPVDTPPTLKPRPPKNPTTSAEVSTGGYGILDFDTRPYTEVFIGKKKMGDTPMLGVRVPAGKVTLTLVNEDAGIHETYTLTIPKDGHVFKKLKF